MKAVVYEKNRSPERLVLREVEKPVPGDREVLVRIHATGVNAADYRSMKMGLVPENGIFGADIAGTVEAAGSGVRRFTPGDRVFADTSGCAFGGFAEFAAVPEHVLAPIPPDLSFDEAAALPMASVTALQALRDKGRIERGYRVLINGAGGGVGTFAVQLAKYFEAEVAAVCGPANVELVKSIGADRVIDYTKEEFTADGARYNLIVLVNGNTSLSACRKSLLAGGACVVVGGAVSQMVRAMIGGPFLSLGGKTVRVLAAKPSAKDLEFIAALTAAGKIRPVMDRSYPLEQTAEAIRYLAQGHARGKVVIKIMQE